MSATEHETPEATTAPAVDLENLSDARIEDQEGFKATLVTLLAAAKKAVTEAKRYTTATKALAEARVQIRSYVIRSNGFPDWAASSDAYSVAVSTAETPVLAPLGADATRRLNQAVRQHVKRNFLLPGIVGFILTHVDPEKKPGLADEVTAWAEADASGKPLNRDSILTGPSQALIKEVRKHYDAAQLTYPEGTPFAEGTSNPPTPGPGPVSPSNAVTAVTKALEGLDQVDPRYAVLGLLSTATALSKKLKATTGEVKDRTLIIKALERVAVIAETTAAILDPSQTVQEKHEKTMTDAYFSEASDKIEA